LLNREQLRDLVEQQCTAATHSRTRKWSECGKETMHGCKSNNGGEAMEEEGDEDKHAKKKWRGRIEE
jgi:hypothetical protein